MTYRKIEGPVNYEMGHYLPHPGCTLYPSKNNVKLQSSRGQRSPTWCPQQLSSTVNALGSTLNICGWHEHLQVYKNHLSFRKQAFSNVYSHYKLKTVKN